MDWKVTAPPEGLAVPLETAELHLRVDTSDEYVLIESLIESATGWAEQYLNLAILEQTITAQMPRFPKGRDIYLPQSNLLEVLEVSYQSAGGDRQTFSEFVENRFSNPGIVRLSKGHEWPREAEDVRIEYKAGFERVPSPISQAILLMVGHWYQNREAVNVGNIVQEVPLSAVALLDQYRVMGV